MNSLIWFLVLLLHQNIGNVAATINCADGFEDYKSTRLCLGVSHVMKAQFSGLCQQSGGTVFVGRMNDYMFERFGKDLKKVKEAVTMDLFIGMKKGGFNSNEWKFSNSKGSVETKKYPFWSKDPGGTNDCGVMRAGETKVIPVGCKQSTIALCEKDKAPCSSKQMDYTEYYGRCLGPSNDKSDYDQVYLFCLEGHIFPVTDEDARLSAVAATYSNPTPVYAALTRQEDGRWLYESGEEETATERFAGGKPGEPGNENCGVYGIDGDGETKIFTTKCDAKLIPLCELKRS